MTSQVLVSTLQSNLAGDVSVLPVPVRFDWLRYLDAKGVTTFFVELLETIWDCREAGEWEKLAEFLSAWEETAYLMQDPVLLARIKQQSDYKENMTFEVARAQLGI